MKACIRSGGAGLVLACLLGLAPAGGAAPAPADHAAGFRLAFGSCLKQGRPQPVWDGILRADPQFFVFAGDNVYADTTDPEVMRRVYGQLAAEPGWQRLRQRCPVFATWDDHDYGANDAGADYPMKEASQDLFFEFFREPADSPRRRRPGVYGQRMVDTPVGRIHVVALDTRWFRGPLQRRSPGRDGYGPYAPVQDPEIPLLGEAQWTWLEEVLSQPADWRLLVSSIQVLPDQHHWEKWGNFPHERERLLARLRDRRMEGVVLLSGDRHHGEISRLDDGIGYPLYEVTASGMNCARRGPYQEPNRFRVGELVLQDHFGMLVFRNRGPAAEVALQLRGTDGRVITERTVRRAELGWVEASPPPEKTIASGGLRR